MKRSKIIGISFLCFFLIFCIIEKLAQAADYTVTNRDFLDAKKSFDDPRPLYQGISYKKIIPPEVYAKLTYDIEEMKRSWAEAVGFKAPDIVNKIAPEIQPGTYTYKDKEKYPGLKQLMIPVQYDMFNPGKPPLVGNFPEIKVIPPRQYYWATPIAEATKKNMGHTKLNDQGYIISTSYEAGYPFPMPSGKFKAQQIVYNWDKTYLLGENAYVTLDMKGITKNFRIDQNSVVDWWNLRLQGRVLLEPYGFFDKRAKEQSEKSLALLRFTAPRDMYGFAFSYVYKQDYKDDTLSLIYINALRRIRKMSATDTQDNAGGQDVIYDDNYGFSQKLSPTRYPYEYELIDEREYLVPAYTTDGIAWISSKGMEYRDIEFERRPLYVVQLTQKDKNYIYSRRILYIDKETFALLACVNYDQKGRLYRTTMLLDQVIPDMGLIAQYHFFCRDYLDQHSTLSRNLFLPAVWVGRDHCDLSQLLKAPK